MQQITKGAPYYNYYKRLIYFDAQSILLSNKQAAIFQFCDFTLIKQWRIQKVIVKQC